MFTSSLILGFLLFFAKQAQASTDFFSVTNTFKTVNPAFVNPETRAQRLFLILTGTPALNSTPAYNRVVSLIEQNKMLEAASLVVRDKNFLQTRLRNFAAPLSSKTLSNLEPFNDLQALIIGVTRDELDARLILTGDIRYSADGAGLPAVSRSDNLHYEQLDQQGFEYSRVLQKTNKQWDDLAIGVGAFTTRAWAKNTFEAGTNRRSVKLAFETFLCAPIESWKTRGLPDDFVRRDVDRAPAGDPSVYLNHCRGCHASMDAMGGAFAKLDFVDNQFVFQTEGVRPKMNQNGDVYPAGYVTIDDSWTNLLNESTAVNFGWRSEITGTGLYEFAQMLANSKAYSSCLVQRVVKELCGLDSQNLPADLIENLASEFETANYNLKFLFKKVAIMDLCLVQ